jgi:hypothetical protein
LKPFELRNTAAQVYTFQPTDPMEFITYINNALADAFLDKLPLMTARIPLHSMGPHISKDELQGLCRTHGIYWSTKDNKAKLIERLQGHHCTVCDTNTMIFRPVDLRVNDYGFGTDEAAAQPIHEDPPSPTPFPPKPAPKSLVETIVRDFCLDCSPESFQESGCAVCGQLVPNVSMVKLVELEGLNLDCLVAPDCTRKERRCQEDPICALEGPVLDPKCNSVCLTCMSSLRKGKRPKLALANGMWVGEVPKELQGLTFPEQMLIAKVRHNRCLVRVSSGRAKLVANAIAFPVPVVKIYHSLPPPIEELDEVLAIMFIGSTALTDEKMKRTPMTVRRNKVANALEWLKLNHADYRDLEISKENLEQYPLNGVPVYVDFRQVSENADPTAKLPTEMSVNDNESSIATEDGECPFVVNGLTGTEYLNMPLKALKAKTLSFLDNGGKMLKVGQGEEPANSRGNPHLYPQMFPWLFPYGLGSIAQERHTRVISEVLMKRRLLMHHDKRFQRDFYFPMVAFNHEQMKGNRSGSYLLAKRKDFDRVF